MAKNIKKAALKLAGAAAVMLAGLTLILLGALAFGFCRAASGLTAVVLFILALVGLFGGLVLIYVPISRR